eukprot:scaffold97288_cov19-Tisochrysis_lutea.AAC.3
MEPVSQGAALRMLKGGVHGGFPLWLQHGVFACHGMEHLCFKMQALNLPCAPYPDLGCFGRAQVNTAGCPSGVQPSRASRQASVYGERQRTYMTIAQPLIKRHSHSCYC